MGRYLMKCEPDRDLYVEWSTVVDNLVWVGTRDEALRLPDTDEKRLARTDETGTSTLWKVEGYPVEGAWDDPTVLVMNTDRSEEHIHSYSLRRADLAAYATALDADDAATAEALLIPNRHCLACDWDVDVDPVSNLCPKHASGDDINPDVRVSGEAFDELLDALDGNITGGSTPPPDSALADSAPSERGE